MVIDGVVYSCPRVDAAISGGKTEICGNYTKQTAVDIARVVTTGKLPLPIKVMSIVRQQ